MQHEQVHEIIEHSDGAHEMLHHAATHEMGTLNGKILLITLLCSFIIMAIHFFAPKIRKIEEINTGILNSIGGGLTLGYVFLHALPSLILDISNVQGMAHSRFLQEPKNMLFVIFLFALGGFFVAYVLEKLAHESTRKGQEANRFIYYSHIMVLAFLSFSVAIIMPIIAQESLMSLGIFTVVMAFHFLLDDHAISHHFPARFSNRGRYIVMGGTLLGVIIVTFVMRHNITVASVFCNAFLLGAMILVTNKTEFSLLEGRSHFPTFVSSLFIKAVVVFIMVLLESAN
jgi:hypothetical protein